MSKISNGAPIAVADEHAGGDNFSLSDDEDEVEGAYIE